MKTATAAVPGGAGGDDDVSGLTAEFRESVSRGDVSVAQAKYVQLLDRAKKFELTASSFKRSLDKLTSERDRIATELLNTQKMTERLRGLCKSLQKENKDIHEQSKGLLDLEASKRQDISRQFTLSLEDVKEKLDRQDRDRERFLAENADLHAHLQRLIEDQDSREGLVKKMVEDFESKRASCEERVKVEEAASAVEKARREEVQRKCLLVAQSEASLRADKKLLTDRFDEMRDGLDRAVKTCQEYKKESDRLRSALQRLQKESADVQRINMHLTKSIADLTEQRDVQKAKAAKLEALCRGLQAERSGLREKVNAIVRETKPPSAESSVPTASSSSSSVSSSATLSVAGAAAASASADQQSAESLVADADVLSAVSKLSEMAENTASSSARDLLAEKSETPLTVVDSTSPADLPSADLAARADGPEGPPAPSSSSPPAMTDGHAASTPSEGVDTSSAAFVPTITPPTECEGAAAVEGIATDDSAGQTTVHPSS